MTNIRDFTYSCPVVPLCWYLADGERFEQLKDCGSCTGRTKAIDRFYQAGQLSQEGLDETQDLVFQVGGWAWG